MTALAVVRKRRRSIARELSSSRLSIGLLLSMLALFSCAAPTRSTNPVGDSSSPGQASLSEEERAAGFTEQDAVEQFGPDATLPVCNFSGPEVSPTPYSPKPGVDPQDEPACRASLTGIVQMKCTPYPTKESTLPICPQPHN